jgi:hypothetical protein
MYLWNYNKLADDFKNDKVTEQEKFKYFFLNLLIGYFFLELLQYSQTKNPTLENIILSSIGILGTIIAVSILYKKNKQNDNRTFIERYICLSIPIMIKMFVFSLITIFVCSIIIAIILGEPRSTEILTSPIFARGVSFVFFIVLLNYCIYKALDRISSK